MLLICNISGKTLAVHHFVNSEEDYYMHTQLSLLALLHLPIFFFLEKPDDKK